MARWTAVAVAALALAPAAIVPAALARQAKIESVEPYHAVVVREGASLKSGEGDFYYPVANLKTGQVLRIDGVSATWARAALPPGSTVYVRPEHVTLDEAGATATLTVPSGLRAPNMTGGFRQSWREAVRPLLSAGTKLTVVSFEDSPDARDRAYRVLAPDQARAFIPVADVRAATEAEIAAYLAATAPAPPPSDGGSPAETVHADGDPQPPDPNVGIDLTAEPPPAQGQPPEDGDAGNAQTPADGVVETTPDQPGDSGQAADPAATDPTQLPVIPAEDLFAKFDELRRTQDPEAEYDELIAEFQRALDALPAGEVFEGQRRALRQRQALLEISRDVQAQRRDLQAARAALSEESKVYADRLVEIEKARGYTIVGRLAASAVYDGTRLPLMFRVQAVGEPVPRTIGYLRPQEGLSLETKLGQVVGVVGDAAVDPALGLNVIAASRVDVLTAAPGQP